MSSIDPTQEISKNTPVDWTNVSSGAVLPQEQEQNGRKVSTSNYDEFWTSSSIGQKKIDKEEDFFRTPPASSASAKVQQQPQAQMEERSLYGNNRRRSYVPPAPEATGSSAPSTKSFGIISDFYEWVSSFFSSVEAQEARPAHGLSDEALAELKATIAVMNALMEEIEVIHNMDPSEIKTTEAHLAAIKAKKEESVIQSQHMHESRKKKQKLEKERFQKMAETIKLAKQGEYGSKFAELASALQLVGVVAGASTGTLGMVVACIAIGSAVDSLLSDPVKKALAGLVSSDQEKVDQAVHYMKIGLGLVAFAVTMGSAISGAADTGDKISKGLRLIQATAALMSGAAVVNEAYVKHHGDSLKATMLDFKYQIDQHHDKFKESLKDLKRLDDSTMGIYKQMQESKNSEYSTIIAGFRAT